MLIHDPLTSQLLDLESILHAIDSRPSLQRTNAVCIECLASGRGDEWACRETSLIPPLGSMFTYLYILI